MKRYIDFFQNKLMDLIIPSLVILLGMVSIFFVFYSVCVALSYTIHNEFNKDVLNKNILLYSFIGELIFIVIICIFLANLSYFTLYPLFVQIIVSSLFIVINYFLISLSFTSLWILSKNPKNKLKVLLRKSIIYVYLTKSQWLIYIVLLVTSIIILINFPALLILIPGFNINIINKICLKSHEAYIKIS